MSEEKSWERPEPVDMSTQTDLTGEGIELLQRQTREMKAKLSDKEALLRDCFLENVIKSDVSVKHYTGLPSKPILDGLFSSIEADKCKLKYWSGKKSVGDMKYEEEGKKPGPKRKLSPYEEFILTLVRLRLGIVGFVLADLFGVSKTGYPKFLLPGYHICTMFSVHLLNGSLEKKISNACQNHLRNRPLGLALL